MLARDETIWGPDAAEMKPSRWFENDGQTLKKFSQWQYHAFNGGASKRASLFRGWADGTHRTSTVSRAESGDL
jgi:hypothetical protein